LLITFWIDIADCSSSITLCWIKPTTIIINPNVYEDAKLREHVSEITDEIIKSAGGAGSKFGTGGMLSKIKSAQMIFDNNSQMILMNGANPRDILRALDGANIGTWFSQSK
jgi:glutamate 5-kinase